MRLTAKFSIFITLSMGLVALVMLIECITGLLYVIESRATHRMETVATLIDNYLLDHSPANLKDRLDALAIPADITRITFMQGDHLVYDYLREPGMEVRTLGQIRHDITVTLVKQPGITLHILWQDSIFNYFRNMLTVTSFVVALIIVGLLIVLALRWLRHQLIGLELLEYRATRIINGERGRHISRKPVASLTRASQAIDILLAEIEYAGEQRSRMDTLIRAHAAQDTKTGLSNRIFFDNQLATLLEDQENVGTYGVVMLIRLPDFDMLGERWGREPIEEYLATLVNMLSTFVMRYPGALLARYFRSDFAVLLPHRTLKEADNIASQLLNAVDSLPPTRMIDRTDMLHIGICTWRSQQTAEQVMEHAEMATRNAMLQGGNSWSVYDDSLPEKGRGNVRWRTLIEQALQRGGPRFYQKPAITRNGVVHHRELMCRIFDTKEEVLSAEYMPLVQQFGLAEKYDTQQITRMLPLLTLWPEETLALQVTVESLIGSPFQRWLRNTLMQYEKSLRQRIIFELAEADVCQHLDRLQAVIRLIKALGVRVAVIQAGLTVVGTSWINVLDVELIKLHPGLVRYIEKRTENQLFVQSLVEACAGTRTRVFATGIRSRNEWQTLMERGVSGGQGEFIAGSQPLDTRVKKYLQRYSV